MTEEMKEPITDDAELDSEVEEEEEEVELPEEADDDDDDVSAVDLGDEEEEEEAEDKDKDAIGFEEDKEAEEEELYTENIDNIITEDNDVDLDDEDDEDDAEYLQKFDDELKSNYISEYHPEELALNYDEVRGLCAVTRNSSNIIVDELHKTLPYLTKYEYTSVLGIRAKQINEGSVPFIKVEKDILDGYLIAQIEIKQKKLPFIIKRPLPNGGIEYWRLSDLEILI